MYSKDEVHQLTKKFWTTFGAYMKPVPNAWGETTNWINYKTGIKHIYLKTIADKNSASISIVIDGDDDTRLKWFQLFENLKADFPEGYTWNLTALDAFNKDIALINKTIYDVNILDESKWGAIIRFLKQELLIFDEFWSNHKDIFSSFA